MATTSIKFHVRFAWWFRAALFAVLTLGRVCPRCVSPCIDFIVDKGAKVVPA